MVILAFFLTTFPAAAHCDDRTCSESSSVKSVFRDLVRPGEESSQAKVYDSKGRLLETSKTKHDATRFRDPKGATTKVSKKRDSEVSHYTPQGGKQETVKVRKDGSAHEYDSKGKKIGSYVKSGNRILHRSATGKTLEIIKKTKDGYRIYDPNGKLIGKVKEIQTEKE